MVDLSVMGLWLGLMTLKVFPNLEVSVKRDWANAGCCLNWDIAGKSNS